MTEPTAQDVVDAWNESFPPGTPVRYWPGSLYGAGQLGATTSVAWVQGEVPVVRVGREAGGIALDRIDPCPEGGESS